MGKTVVATSCMEREIESVYVCLLSAPYWNVFDSMPKTGFPKAKNEGHTFLLALPQACMARS